MTAPIYAVGDIHGHTEQLEIALDRITRDGGPDAQVVFLGDYVDRGPDSKGVIDALIDGLDQGRNWTTLLGNHDRMFAWFMEDVPRHDPHLLVGYHWLHDRLGGLETLASYGLSVEPRTRLEDLHARAKPVIPQAHVDFLFGLQPMFETEQVAFVHAGIRPGIALADQSESDLVWIRQAFHDHAGPHPKLIVHGHTPVSVATHYGNRINLDSGAGYGHPLSTAVFEDRDCWLLTDQGRVPLNP
ncbi:MAG: metallophosphoesterase family protein [Pseudomonadota bacterium]